MSVFNIENAVRIGLLSSTLCVSAACERAKDPIQPISTVEPGELRKIPFVENLDQEIAERVRPNIVTIRRITKEGYKHVTDETVTCSGFVVRNVTNAPVAITALHCSPETVVSAQDGETYSTRLDDGTTIFDIDAIGQNEAVYASDSLTWFQNPDNHGSRDIIAVHLIDFSAPGLPINANEPNQNDTYYIARQLNGDIALSPLHYLESKGGVFSFIDIASTAPCVPGSSGSAIINTAGEVVASVFATTQHQIIAKDAQVYELEAVHIGRLVNTCLAVPSSQITNLYND